MKIWISFAFFTYFVASTMACFGQTRLEKTEYILQQLDYVKSLSNMFEFQISSLKQHLSGQDSIKLLELESRLTYDEVRKRIFDIFDELYTAEEIDDIYDFFQTTAFKKGFQQGGFNDMLTSQFEDLENEINDLQMVVDGAILDEPAQFTFIPVEAEDGFYTLVDYYITVESGVDIQNPSDVKLAEKPCLTSKDIAKVEKVYNEYRGVYPQLSIKLTKEGAKKWKLITQDNLGKPIALVIDKNIVTMPSVYQVITSGNITMDFNFPEELADKIVERLSQQ